MRRRGRLPWSVLWLGLALSSASTALAFETRFQVDPAQNLAELSRTGQVSVSAGRLDGVYTLDASAVLRADPDALLRASTDYDRYREMGVPNLRESHVVAITPGGDVLYTWSWMSLFGQSSKHYLAVQVVKGLGPARAAGIQWRLARPRAGWPHEEGSAFTRLEGSWYLEPLGDGAVYVRYFLTAVLDRSLPEGMVSWLIKRQLAEGARSLVQALGREAARRSWFTPGGGPPRRRARGPDGEPGLLTSLFFPGMFLAATVWSITFWATVSATSSTPVSPVACDA